MSVAVLTATLATFGLKVNSPTSTYRRLVSHPLDDAPNIPKIFVSPAELADVEVVPEQPVYLHSQPIRVTTHHLPQIQLCSDACG